MTALFPSSSPSPSQSSLPDTHLAAGEQPDPMSDFQVLHNESYDALFKVILLGDSGVGKSSVLSRLTGKGFSLNTKATIGVEFAVKTLPLASGSVVKLQLWDTAGQERYRSISKSYYRGAVAGVVVYDITDAQSFANVGKWVKELRDYGSPDAVIMMIGNKRDLGDLRSVYLNEARDFAVENKFAFIETSARTDIGIVTAFDKVAEEVYRREGRERTKKLESEERRKKLKGGKAISLGEEGEGEKESSSSCC